MAASIYAVMADKLPPWVRTEIDAICRKFLWVGQEQSIRGKCTVAWPVVTTPAVFGGLGVINLKLSSWAMQTRWLWLQRTDESRAWASITISVGDGMRTKFWTDRWQCQTELGPGTSPAVPAIASYLLIWDRLENTYLQPDVPDRCIWRWTDHGSSTFAGADLVWKTWAPLKVKLFLWLAFKERLWTADRRRRHGLAAPATCHLCNLQQETVHHLFVSCPFTVQELFAPVAWHIWKERNARLFRGDSLDHQQLLRKIKTDADMWVAAGAKSLGSLLGE
ncbi:hypothetical protein PVAP13_9NG670114 [Panicum virgatum]|uniref:Reverse transcriptase zinc-binding domain-containing protein n=1 Tax=Panicum virgatum TaxID=38727 RepID=A0A8T0MZ59_PANVG|nr:hypothetical protein PVAP13_9NG670114 [Panicum virgatum]